MRILVVEDEQHILNMLSEQLRNEGYAVDTAPDGEDGYYLASEYPIDIAVIDIGLPKMTGIEIIQKVRAEGKSYPILILTARGKWQDKVEGLDAGADDYLVKPFAVEELLARLNALIRRSKGFAKSTVDYGPLSLDTKSQVVTVNGFPLDITAYEYKVMEYLMLHPSEVVSKTVLTDHIYEQDYDRDSNVIEVFIGRLRKKIDPDNTIKPIETLRGRGYRLNTKSLNAASNEAVS